MIGLVFLFMNIFLGNAQNNAPKGFLTGKLVMVDGSSHSGLIKESLRKNGSLVLLDVQTGKKETFTASNLLELHLDQGIFMTIQGDFFKIIADGNIRFLQKASDASGKITFNGTEAVLSNGTPGKPDDYFFYNSINGNLELITAKTFDKIMDVTFAANNALLGKAKKCKSDFEQLKEAVILLNAGK